MVSLGEGNTELGERWVRRDRDSQTEGTVSGKFYSKHFNMLVQPASCLPVICVVYVVVIGFSSIVSGGSFGVPITNSS